MIHLIDHETRRTLLRVDLSDCWTDNGKPIWFRLRKLQSPISNDVQAISFVLGPLSVKFGWISTDHFGEPNKMVPAAFDALLRRITRPKRFCPRVAKVLSTPAPWDAECDKTSTSVDQ